MKKKSAPAFGIFKSGGGCAKHGVFYEALLYFYGYKIVCE